MRRRKPLKKHEYPREPEYGRGLLMSYSVEAMDEQVTMPAGSHAHCAHRRPCRVTLLVDPVRGLSKVRVTSAESHCRIVRLWKPERVDELSSTFYSDSKLRMVPTDFAPQRGTPTTGPK